MAHVADGGGLQQHSVGDTYPFMVVGTQHRRMDQVTLNTRWYVMNCATGDRFYGKTPFEGEIITWPDIASAEMVAQQLKDKFQGPCIYRVR